VRPPKKKILDRHYKIRPSTDLRAKFHAGRPTHLGDLASEEKNIMRKTEVLPKTIVFGRTNKSSGPDYIYPRVLYELPYQILSPSLQIFQQSFKIKVLPLDWKEANVVPIFKKGKKCELNNYRPVSLTSSVCKIFESIVRDNLLEHFKQNKYFSDRQFGFLKGKSNVTQLLSMLDDWTELLESGGRIDGIYTDLEKAFDKVPHRRLISKLHSYQVNNEIILWIESFSYR